MAKNAKYSQHADYLIAAILYLARTEAWRGRTAKNMADELSLDLPQLEATLDSFPAIFRKSVGTGKPHYSLAARHPERERDEIQWREKARKSGFEPNEPGSERIEKKNTPLDPEMLKTLLSFVAAEVERERRYALINPVNWIPILAAVVAAGAAIFTALVS